MKKRDNPSGALRPLPFPSSGADRRAAKGRQEGKTREHAQATAQGMRCNKKERPKPLPMVWIQLFAAVGAIIYALIDFQRGIDIQSHNRQSFARMQSEIHVFQRIFLRSRIPEGYVFQPDFRRTVVFTGNRIAVFKFIRFRIPDALDGIGKIKTLVVQAGKVGQNAPDPAGNSPNR